MVFDVSQNLFSLVWPLIIALSASLFALIGWAMRQSSERVRRVKGVAFQCFGALGVVAGLLCLVSNYFAIRGYTKALSNHDYAVAEGVVVDFVPVPPGGHAEESFRIKETSSRTAADGDRWSSILNGTRDIFTTAFVRA